LRRRFGIEEGSLVIAEDREEGILIHPVVAVPLESYSQERMAEFLLSSAVDDEDYTHAEEEEVRKTGLDPAAITHQSLRGPPEFHCGSGISGRNVLFSVPYRPDAGLRRLWRLPRARLITSAYAAEEARRNLSNPEQRRELYQSISFVAQ